VKSDLADRVASGKRVSDVKVEALQARPIGDASDPPCLELTQLATPRELLLLFHREQLAPRGDVLAVRSIQRGSELRLRSEALFEPPHPSFRFQFADGTAQEGACKPIERRERLLIHNGRHPQHLRMAVDAPTGNGVVAARGASHLGGNEFPIAYRDSFHSAFLYRAASSFAARVRSPDAMGVRFHGRGKRPASPCNTASAASAIPTGRPSASDRVVVGCGRDGVDWGA
jgi:hypothetical protein